MRAEPELRLVPETVLSSKSALSIHTKDVLSTALPPDSYRQASTSRCWACSAADTAGRLEGLLNAALVPRIPACQVYCSGGAITQPLTPFDRSQISLRATLFFGSEMRVLLPPPALIEGQPLDSDSMAHGHPNQYPLQSDAHISVTGYPTGAISLEGALCMDAMQCPLALCTRGPGPEIPSKPCPCSSPVLLPALEVPTRGPSH
jgi:hypothetical protein